MYSISLDCFVVTNQVYIHRIVDELMNWIYICILE